MATTAAISPHEIPDLRQTLKRCSEATYQAARIFRQTANPRYLPGLIRGILEQFVDEDARPALVQNSSELRLCEDLGIDSLTLMEVAIVTEDAVGFRIEVEELRHLATVGEIERLLAAKSLRQNAA